MKFMKDMDDGARDDNVIIIEITGSNGAEKMDLKDFLVSTRMYIPGHDSDFVTIKPKRITDNTTGKEVLYWYALYDLCLVTPQSSVQIKIDNKKGEFTGSMLGKVDPVQTFRVVCVEKDSDWFTPRQEHAACNTWDQKLWVFGGQNFIGERTNFLNDLLYYDELSNKWVEIKPKGPVPKPRHGHLMFCYYNYLVVYGGQGENQHIYGDLWMFDVVKEDWHQIMDAENVHNLIHQDIEGIIPSPRVFAAGELNEKFGAAYITGGKTKDFKTVCDMWVLNLEKMVEYVEQPTETAFVNIWQRKDVTNDMQTYFCRWGHTTGFVDSRYMLVYGGVNQDDKVVRDSFVFDMLEYYIVPLNEMGDKPSVRLTNSNLLEAGNGMMTLYGGEDVSHRGHFTDIWHLRIHVEKAHVDFTKFDYKKGDHEHQILSWRYGFTLHYLKSQNDPVMIGGTYGNHQESQIMLVLPEDKCADQGHFEEGLCVPCPRGSIFSNFTTECQWCPLNSYFNEDLTNYFESECDPCPAGTVGGYDMECVACESGTIYDASANYQNCRPCQAQSVCPLGTKYEFSALEFAPLFDDVVVKNVPETYKPEGDAVDRTASVVFFIWSLLGTLILVIIALMNNACKEKSLFVFREIDLLPITGGNRKRWIGGIITVFYFMIIFIIINGFLMHWLFYNRRIESSEVTELTHHSSLPESFKLEIVLYSSVVLEDHNKKSDREDGKAIGVDLCPQIYLINSAYFDYAEEKNFTCQRTQLSEFTDAYTLNFVAKNIMGMNPRGETVRFNVESEYSRIFHFFKWEFMSIWEWEGKYPSAYS